MRDLSFYKDKLIRSTTRLEDATVTYKELEQSVITIGNNLKSVEEAQAFFQMVAKETQEQIKFHIEDIVNMALQALFPIYTFELLFEEARGKTEAILLLVDTDGNKYSPLEDNGGGVSAVVSFALRMALLVLSKNRRTLILDQPFSDISQGALKEKMYGILKELTRELGVQTIIVSHDNQLNEIADNEIKINKKYGKSIVEV